MKFGEIVAMETRVKQGAWMPATAFPGVSMKVRGIGNMDYQKARAKAAASADGDDIPDEEMARIIADTLLLDWTGFEDRDYSPEAAREALQASVFRAAVFECAMAVATKGRESAEAVAKN